MPVPLITPRESAHHTLSKLGRPLFNNLNSRSFSERAVRTDALI